MNKDNIFMKKAIKLAKISQSENEVPVGAIIVKNNIIIGTGRNRREFQKNALYHAEIEAINSACKFLNSWRLCECDMYVTLEPCPMCAGAIINSRIAKIIFGAYDFKSGVFGSILNLCDYPFNHKPVIKGGILLEESSELLSNFFKNLRK